MNTAEIFEPEKIWSYEVGVKGSWLDDRLRTNASAFYYDYEDLQVNQFSGVTNLITNAATSKIAGVEAEILARPTGALELDFSAAYLDATYREYLTRDANLPGAPVVDLSGNRMPKAPELTLTAGAELSTAVTSAGARLVLRGEARYQSSAFFDQFETPQLEQGGYSIVNARLVFAGADDRWSIAAFGRNLGDKLYRQGMVRVDNVFGTVAFLGAPRTYGFEVTARF
jgi:iron complex outermembrane receptor protein